MAKIKKWSKLSSKTFEKQVDTFVLSVLALQAAQRAGVHPITSGKFFKQKN